MNTAPPNSSNHGVKIAWLIEQLGKTTKPCERMPLLTDLSMHFRLVDPVESVKYAQEALRVASSVNDRHWTMMSYIRLAEGAGSQSNYSRALRYFTKARQLLDELPDDFQVRARVHRGVGHILTEMGRMRAGLDQLETALQLAEQAGSKMEIVAILSTMGGACIDMGLYSKGLTFIKEAQDIARSIAFDNGSAIAHSQMGRIYFFLENWDLALDNYRKSLAFHQKIGSNYGMARSYAYIGSVYAKQGRYEKSLKLCNLALELFERINNPFVYAEVLANVGVIWVMRKEFEKGLCCLNEAERRHDAIGNRHGKGTVLLQKGEAYIDMMEWKKAIVALSEGLNILGEAGFQTMMITVERLLARAYEEDQNLERSLYHYKRFMEFERMLLGNEVREQLATHRFGDRVRRIEVEKETYRAKADRLKREVEKRSKEVTLLSMQVGQNDDLLMQLRERLLHLKHADKGTFSVINGIVREIDNRTGRIDAWTTFERQLRTLDQDFLNRLMEAWPSLTPAEMRVCSLLRVNISNKEIGALLNLSDRTVDTHRTNIRKKMGLGRDQNLVTALAKV